jgi:hypothetical protein
MRRGIIRNMVLFANKRDKTMKTVYRWLAPLALLPTLLTGCASAPPVPLAPSPEPMSIRRAVDLLGAVYVASDNLKGTPSGLRIDAAGLTLRIARDSGVVEVACPYAAAPNPLLDSSRLWPALTIACRVDNKATTYPFLMAFPAKNATPPEYARAWQVMRALAAPETPEETAAFVAALAGFRAGKVGPGVGEAVRPHKVAAELAVKDKRLWDAADEFAQGLALAPWWPQGNFNLALVYGELRAYPLAARYMQRYLELVPDAPNARAAQDKVYEWTAAQRAGG